MERQRDRDRDRDRERQRETETERDIERERETDRQTDRDRESPFRFTSNFSSSHMSASGSGNSLLLSTYSNPCQKREKCSWGRLSLLSSLESLTECQKKQLLMLLIVLRLHTHNWTPLRQISALRQNGFLDISQIENSCRQQQLGTVNWATPGKGGPATHRRLLIRGTGQCDHSPCLLGYSCTRDLQCMDTRIDGRYALNADGLAKPWQ